MNENNQLTCYTIGHSTHMPERFIGLLQQHAITCVADVRSAPYSRRNPQYNRETIKRELQLFDMAYVYLGDQMGARQTAPELLYPGTRTVCFAKVRELASFQAGIDRIIQGLKEGFRVALMCAEKDPFDCHRFMLVSYALAKRGIKVCHILADGEMIAQEDLEERLLATYREQYQQPSLFSAPKSRAAILDECYDRRNRAVGYTLPDESARPAEPLEYSGQ